MVEQRTENPRVGGSTPPLGTFICLTVCFTLSVALSFARLRFPLPLIVQFQYYPLTSYLLAFDFTLL